MTPRMGEQLALALALEGRIDAAQEETAQLVALAGTLAALPDPEIDGTFAAALEARLLSDGQETAPAPVARPHLTVVPAAPARAPKTARPALRPNVVRMPSRRFVVRRSIAAVAAAAMLAAFPVAAMGSSLPGSPLYGMKLRLERLQLAVFGTPVEDGFRNMDFATRRLEEAGQAQAIGRGPDVVAGLISAAKASTQAARALILGATNDPATLTRFAEQVAQTQEQMATLQPVVEKKAKTALAGAMDAASQIQRDLAALLGTTAPALLQTPDALAAQSDTTEVSSTDSAEPSTDASSTEGGSVNTSDNGSVRDRVRETRDGAGKNQEDSGEACEVVGSENGLGDTLAPLTRLYCD